MDSIKDYEKFFKEIRFDQFQNNRDFLDVIDKIVSLGKLHFQSFHQKEQVLTFSRKFNASWMKMLLKQKTISPIKGRQESIVCFSSFHKGVHWLSNFFLTLIFDPTNEVFYPSVEHGYVWYKKEIGAKVGKDQPRVDEDSKIPMEELFKKSPKEIKQWGRQFVRGDDSEAIREMGRLVELKFKQNPVLEDLLKGSSPARLHEATSDMFWGTGFGAGGANHLGKILEGVRHLI